MSSKEPYDFAYTRFLVDIMRGIYEDVSGRFYAQGLERIYWLMPFLSPEICIQLEDEEAQIMKHRFIAQETNPRGHMVDQTIESGLQGQIGAGEIVRPILKKTMMLLHEAGYFKHVRFSGIDKEDFEDLRGEMEATE